MNTRAEVLFSVMPRVCAAPGEAETCRAVETEATNFGRIANEQIRGLVRHLFLPGWPRPLRQIVFSTIDETSDAGWLCQRVGEELVSEITGEVGVVDVNLRALLKHQNGGTAEYRLSQKSPGELRKSSRQLGERLWLVPADVFAGGKEVAAAPLWLRGRLAQLRVEFEYVLLQSPSAETSSDVGLLGSLCDGVVLVLRADTTRRRTAQSVRQGLQAANARLLGTVLVDRVFPVPERIYRRL